MPWQPFRQPDGLCRGSSPPRQLPNTEVARHDHDHSDGTDKVENSLGHILLLSHRADLSHAYKWSEDTAGERVGIYLAAHWYRDKDHTGVGSTSQGGSGSNVAGPGQAIEGRKGYSETAPALRAAKMAAGASANRTYRSWLS